MIGKVVKVIGGSKSVYDGEIMDTVLTLFVSQTGSATAYTEYLVKDLVTGDLELIHPSHLKHVYTF